MPLEKGQKLVDKYTIIDKIGQGGFGIVYLAEEDITHAEVAIKALRMDLPDEQMQKARDRFEREIRIGRHLKSDHTVTMHTFARKGNNIYLVLEYMPGGSLADLLKPIKLGEKPPLPIEDAIRMTREVCHALDHLHSHALEFIHRDITPYNILLDEKGHAKLMDLGLVQEPGSSSDRSRGLGGEHPGHPSYKSPEAENTRRHLTPTSDIYMLGAVLFELLTKRLYKNRPEGTPPGELRPDVPPELDAVVLKAVAENPKDRYRTAAEFDAALGQIESQLEAIQEARARQKQLADLYAQLQNALENKQWQKALDRVADIESIDPAYEDTAQLKAAAETQKTLAKLYTALKRAHTKKQWKAVREKYVEIAKLDPAYRDSKTLKADADYALDIAATLEKYYRELQTAAKNKQWEAVLDWCAKINAIDARYRDTKAIETRANTELTLRRHYTNSPKVRLTTTHPALSLNRPASSPPRTGWLWLGLAIALIAIMGWAKTFATSNAQTNATANATAKTFATSNAQTNATATANATAIATSVLDMVYVPAGEFTMGSNDGNSDEQPVHTVYLDGFYIDKYEVTNALFRECVDAGACDAPTSCDWGKLTYNEPGKSDYPVVCVDWNDANTYCQWAGKQLPTEAQWEKAARGTDGRTYPWGESIDCDKAQYWSCGGETVPVGTKNGVSPYGAYDMAGNVWEWVADWYDSTYYANSPAANPGGPTIGQWRVLRGGSWSDNDNSLRVANRVSFLPDDSYLIFGFRCVLVSSEHN